MTTPDPYTAALSRIEELTQSQDVILAALSRGISHAGRASFAIFTRLHHIHLSKARTASPVHDAHQQIMGWSHYRLLSYGHVKKICKIRYDPQTQVVQIYEDYEWLSVRQFLEKISGNLPEGTVTWATMACWWKATGRSFRLFDLPSELRMTIYRCAFLPTSCENFGFSQSQIATQLGVDAVTGSALLLTNRQVYREASKISHEELGMWDPSTYLLIAGLKRVNQITSSV